MRTVSLMTKLPVYTKVLETATHKLTRGFGGEDAHKGLDIVPASTSETPAVLAYDAGTVIATGNVSGIYKTTNTQGMGTYVSIQHKDGSITRYQHLKYNSVTVKVGDKVKKGEPIAVYGRPTTGNSSGPHLHFDISFPTKPNVNHIKSTYLGQCRFYVDPTPYLQKKPASVKYKVTASSLRIRKQSSLAAPIIGYLKKGEVVSVFEKQNGFGRISNGWVSLQYLKEA